MFNLKGLKQHYESKRVIKEILGHFSSSNCGQWLKTGIIELSLVHKGLYYANLAVITNVELKCVFRIFNLTQITI